MNKTKIIVQLSQLESNILDIIENKEEFTQSDLQGAIQAQLLNAYNLNRSEK